jgi:hypothetical protein
MSDGITDAFKKGSIDDEIKRETHRIKFLKAELKKAKRSLRELKRNK